MIEIRVGGESLELAGNTKVRFKLRSQVFETEFLALSYSFPIALPWTPTNARLMRHYDRMANTATFDPIPCEIHLGGVFWRTADIMYRGYKNGNYDIDLSIPPDPLITAMRERSLQDFQYDGPYPFTASSSDVSAWNDLFDARTGSIDDTPFIFAPIRNTGIFGDRDGIYWNSEPGDPNYGLLSQPTGFVNHGRMGNWIHYTADPGTTFWFQDYSPFPYLAFAIEHIVESLGYTLSGDVFDDPEVRTMVIVSNMYHGLNVQMDGSGGFVGVLGTAYSPIHLERAMPVMSVIEFLVALMRRFNAIPVFRSGHQMEFISRHAILSSGEFDDITDLMVPSEDMDTDEVDGFTIEATEEPLEQRDRAEQYDPDRLIGVVNTEADLAALTPNTGDFARVRFNNTIWQYRDDPLGTQWFFFSDYLYPYIEDPSEETLNVGVALTRMWTGDDDLGGFVLIPEIEMVMSDSSADWHSLGLNDATALRLLFYRGIQPASIGDDYPLLTTEQFTFDGDSDQDWQMAERIEGEDGIKELWYDQWIDFLRRTRGTQRKARLPLAAIMNFDFSRKRRVVGVDYLVESVDVEFTTSSMGLALLEMRKV